MNGPASAPTIPPRDDPELGQLLQSHVSLPPPRGPLAATLIITLMAFVATWNAASTIRSGGIITCCASVLAACAILLALIIRFRWQLADTAWHCYERGVVRVRGKELLRVRAVDIRRIAYRCVPSGGYLISAWYIVERVEITCAASVRPLRIYLKSKLPEAYGYPDFTGPMYPWVERISRQLGEL